MGKINLTAVTIAGGVVPKDQALLALKIKEFRQLPPLAVMNRQLEAFLPGGAVERLLIEWNQWEVDDDIPNRLNLAIADLEALLPKKERNENLV